jgi:hypothetical protein
MNKWMRAGVLALYVALAGVSIVGCEKGPAEKAGEKVDNAVDDMKDAVTK